MFLFNIPTKIIFGGGSLDSLGTLALPGKKALIVTGGTSVKKFGYLNKLTAQLKLAGISFEIYDKILPNPITAHVEEAAKAITRENCDFVIGIGGGSAIDSAKAAALTAANENSFWDFINGGTGLNVKPKNKPYPLVAIPTTAGTGTEADPWMVISNNEEKIGYGTPDTFPVLSIVDPNLTLTVPPHLTAYQGFDALFHSTEGYINKNSNSVSDMYCEKVFALIGQNLPACVENGNDIKAREQVSLASLLSGFVESLSGCTSCHSLEHALSAAAPTLEHGAGLILLSLEYYRYFIEADVCPEKFVTMAKLLGNPAADKPQDFLLTLENLIKSCKADALKMSEYNIRKEELKNITAIAYDTMGGLFSCDRKELDFKAALKIYEKSYR